MRSVIERWTDFTALHESGSIVECAVSASVSDLWSIRPEFFRVFTDVSVFLWFRCRSRIVGP